MRRTVAELVLCIAVVCGASAARAQPATEDAIREPSGPYWLDVGARSARLLYEHGGDALDIQSTAGIVDAIARPGPDGGRLHEILLDELEPGQRYEVTLTGPAGATTTSIQTPPIGGDLSLLVYGDVRTNHAVHRRVVRQMATHEDAHAVLHTGDFVEVGGRPADWHTYFEIAAPLLETRALFPCLGNHEIYGPGGRRRFHRYFMPTAQTEYAAWTYGPVRIISVDSNDEFGEDSHQLEWLQNELESARDHEGVRFVVVLLHHGPISSGRHGDHRRLRPLGVVDWLRAAKVDLVISGHDHMYERGTEDGLKYIVTGGGGAPLYDVNRHHPAQQAFAIQHHFLRLDFEGDAMRLTTIDDEGEDLERCEANGQAGPWRCALEVGRAQGQPPPTGMHWIVWLAIGLVLFAAALFWRSRLRR